MASSSVTLSGTCVQDAIKKQNVSRHNGAGPNNKIAEREGRKKCEALTGAICSVIKEEMALRTLVPWPPLTSLWCGAAYTCFFSLLVCAATKKVGARMQDHAIEEKMAIRRTHVCTATRHVGADMQDHATYAPNSFRMLARVCFHRKKRRENLRMWRGTSPYINEEGDTSAYKGNGQCHTHMPGVNFYLSACAQPTFMHGATSAHRPPSQSLQPAREKRDFEQPVGVHDMSLLSC
eukprot:scaffold300934_cov19-Tisochrysis_lutea.AAC.1